VRSLRRLRVLRENAGKLALKSIGALWPPNFVVVLRHAASRLRREPWRSDVVEMVATGGPIDPPLISAVNWLKHSQDVVGTGGVGSYQLFGWTTGYPEVTGYIIPTMWDCYRLTGEPELARRATWMADWELSIQQPGGGWEGGAVGEGEPPIVFNTGQVIRGLARTYEELADEKYLESAIRAADWIVSTQDPDGSWTTANFRQMKRVYDSYVSAPLAQLARAQGRERYAEAARRNCEFVLSQQRENGWFDLCDNSPYFNDAPSTHTICYTIDGLLETGEQLGDPRLVDSAMVSAHALMRCVSDHGYLPGRLDTSWRPRVNWVCLTGSAQLGIILMKLHARTGREDYLETARSLAGFLVYVQRLGAIGVNRTGALPGSYPIWGTYAPLRFPSWATKYFIDLLLLIRRAEEARAEEVSDLVASDQRPTGKGKLTAGRNAPKGRS
jgi:uncharacterized protein YyaL (SSP411 family)